MDDDTKQRMEGFKAAVERIRSGESASEEVDFLSGRVRLSPDETGEMGIKIETLDEDPDDRGKRQPDPEMKKAIERIKEVTERFRTGELDVAEVPLPSGDTMHLSRDNDVPGAFTARSCKGGPAMRSVPFKPSLTRPPGYPGDLPFLPECAVALAEVGEGTARTLTWFAAEDPEGSLKEIRLQLSAEGWEETGESKASTGHGTMLWIGFKKGELGRALALSRFGEHAQLMLMEHPQRKDKGGEGGNPGSNAL